MLYILSSLLINKSKYRQSTPSAILISFLEKEITEIMLSINDAHKRNIIAYRNDGESPELCQSIYCKLLQLRGEK
jgi:hypothetical protein